MSFESTRRHRISADNIRQLLANGGYRREGIGAVPRREALVFAIEDAATHDHIDLIEELIAQGADIAKCAAPLIAACEMGHIHIVRYLCELGSNVNGRGIQGETPLMAAASCGHPTIVRLLLDQGADSTMHDTETDSKDALGWAKMGFAEPNWPNGIPADVRDQFQEVISILTDLKLNPDKSDITNI